MVINVDKSKKPVTSWLVAWYSGNALDLINEFTVRQTRLVPRWVTACGQVKHLGM